MVDPQTDGTPHQHAADEVRDRRHSHARIGRRGIVVTMRIGGRFLTGHDGPNDISRKHEAKRDPPHNRSCPGVRGLATGTTRYSPSAITGHATAVHVTVSWSTNHETDADEAKHGVENHFGATSPAGGTQTGRRSTVNHQACTPVQTMT